MSNTNLIESDVVILGGGPSGMFAGVMCGMVGLSCTIVDCLDELGGQCIKVYPEKYIFDIPGHPKILAKDLIHNLEEQLRRFEPNLVLNTEVHSVKKNENEIIIETRNHTIKTGVLVLANGNGTIKPIRPLLDNIDELEKGGYVQYSLSNMEMFKDKTVVVAGGGDSALDWCLALSDAGAKQIHLVHRRDKLRGVQSLQEEVARKSNVEFVLSTNIISVTPKDKQIEFELASADTTRHLTADYLIPCYGVMGDKDFFKNSDLGVEMDNVQRVIVDPATSESSIHRIYAVGDSSSYLHKRHLIAVGFAEAVNALHHARENYFNHKPFVLEHSSSKFK